ncbi:MAG: hypothetical protein H0U27_05360, partial [Nitrosopumilus sp.]|nr:hypothetical protein [Nitrosopumilus sp.]
MSIQECFQVAKYFIYRMVTNFIVKIGIISALYIEMMNHMQQKTADKPLGIDFLGRYKIIILFAGNFAISEIGSA